MSSIEYNFGDSSVLDSAEYDQDNENLDIKFRNGNIYTFCNVSKNRFTRLCKSPSAGSYFNTHIKGRYASVGPRNKELESVLNNMASIED